MKYAGIDIGSRTIELVVLTHPEADHIGEFPEILSQYDVGLVIDSGKTKDSNPF